MSDSASNSFGGAIVMQSYFDLPMDASAANREVMSRVEDRISAESRVIEPCLTAFKDHFLPGTYKPEDLLDNLTRWLLETREETETLIRQRMSVKWPDTPEQAARSTVNSLRRSAGTNYEGLVTYALARYLLETQSSWYLDHPFPEGLREALAVVYTGGASAWWETTQKVTEAPTTESKSAPTVVRIAPEANILIRNARWEGRSGLPEPVILLSVMTSLADRAAIAARWKNYFDLAASPCPHRDLHGCAYARRGLQLTTTTQYDVRYGIVTANIYKIRYSKTAYRSGELASRQTLSNTFMFDLKFTTRNDGIAVTPEDWSQFSNLPIYLSKVSDEYGLPG